MAKAMKQQVIELRQGAVDFSSEVVPGLLGRWVSLLGVDVLVTNCRCSSERQEFEMKDGKLVCTRDEPASLILEFAPLKKLPYKIRKLNREGLPCT